MTERGLVLSAVAETHASHAAALHEESSSASAFLGEAALLAVRALNGAGALTLLPAMHRGVNAMRPGLVDPEAALNGYEIEWRMSNQSGWLLSMGDTLRLTNEGSGTSLHSSAPAVLHTLRTRLSMDAAPYLNQARTKYLGGMSELDATLHPVHPPDDELEVVEVTIFVEGAGETPPPPPPDRPGVRGNETNPPLRRCGRRVPPGAHLVPRPPGRLPTRLAAGPTNTCPPPSPGPGAPTTKGRSSGNSSWKPPYSSSSSKPAGTRAGLNGHPNPALRGSARAPPPPSWRLRHRMEYTPSCPPRRSPPSRGSTLCGSPRQPLTTPEGPGP